MSEGSTLEFVIDNIMLIILAVISGGALLWPLLNKGASGIQVISPEEAVLLLSRNKPLVLDVRETAAYEAGHIQGAKHIPLAELNDRLKEIQKYKEKPVIVHCQRGMRTKAACSLLRAQSFTQLHQLHGGINAWEAANLPLTK